MACAFSMMSSSRRVAFSEGKGAVSVDLSLEALFAHRLFDHVYLAAENLGEAFLELIHATEVVETWFREILPQAHRHINIVRWTLSARHRAEQGNAHHASGAEIVFMRFQGAYDLVTVHGFILPIPFLPVKALVYSTVCGGLTEYRQFDSTIGSAVV